MSGIATEMTTLSSITQQIQTQKKEKIDLIWRRKKERISDILTGVAATVSMIVVIPALILYEGFCMEGHESQMGREFHALLGLQWNRVSLLYDDSHLNKYDEKISEIKINLVKLKKQKKEMIAPIKKNYYIHVGLNKTFTSLDPGGHFPELTSLIVNKLNDVNNHRGH